MNLTIILITIFRPFMPIYARMRASWIGQTIIYYQLLVYSGLVPGVFGYTIDMGQEGMLKSSRRYAFGHTAPKVDSEQEFLVFKYVQNDFVPKIFEEVHAELLCLMFITLVCLILKALHTRGVKEMRFFEIAKNIRSSVFLFAFVPFFVHYTHNLISLAYSKDHTAYSVIFMVIGTFKVVIYINNFKKMAQGISDINTLHSKGVYQEGRTRMEQGMDWGFDTYVSMDTNITLRLLEIFGFILITLLFTGGFVMFTTAAAVSLAVYVFLLIASINKYTKYAVGTQERDTQKRITLFSIFHLICITINHIIYIIFWIAKELSLAGTKVLTYIWYIFTFMSLAILIIQLVWRLLTLSQIPEYAKLQEEHDEKMEQQMSARLSQRQPINNNYKPVKDLEPPMNASMNKNQDPQPNKIIMNDKEMQCSDRNNQQKQQVVVQPQVVAQPQTVVQPQTVAQTNTQPKPQEKKPVPNAPIPQNINNMADFNSEDSKDRPQNAVNMPQRNRTNIRGKL